MSRPKKTIVVDEEVTVPCCACSGTVMFAMPKDTPEDRPTFFHTIPYCDRFDKTNTVDDIIAYMRDCSNKVINKKRS